MLEFLTSYKIEKATSAIYYAVRALRHLKGMQLENVKSESSIQEKDLGLEIINRISDNEKKLLSDFSNSDVDRYIIELYNYLEKRKTDSNKVILNKDLLKLKEWRNESVHNYQDRNYSIKNKSRVFLGYAYNSNIKNEIKRFLAKLDIEIYAPDEFVNAGQTTYEKFLENASNIDLAIFILTEQNNKSVRDNVIFELGFLLGKLGRNRVILLTEGNTSIPSDLMGMRYFQTQNIDWKKELLKQFDFAGIYFNKKEINNI
jgi:predicted nucleotide-binding protein